jgi:hypothetical protein
VVAIFTRLGWRMARSGNHIIMTRPGHRATLSIPIIGRSPVARFAA